MKISTQQIGDGKLPNRYWVSIHNNYYINTDNCHDWASDTRKFKCKSKTIGVYKTYKKAREAFDGIELEETIDGIKVMGKSIEDRLTGQLVEEVLTEVKTFEPIFNEDLQFTIDEMKKKNIKFI